MKRFLKQQEGQSAIIIAGALVVLIALLAAVADAGNAYVQRRKMQNAMDAGAQAGALALALNKSDGQIGNAISTYVGNNGVDPAAVHSYYVVQDTGGNSIVTSTAVGLGGNNPPPTKLQVDSVWLPVIGIQVQGDKVFDTFFAGVVGWKTMQVSAGAAAYASKGACSGNALFPIALNAATFYRDSPDGLPHTYTEQDNPTYFYPIFHKSGGQVNGPGNFGWLAWNPTWSGDDVLVNEMNNPSLSGPWQVGDNVPALTGTQDSSQQDNVRAVLQSYINSRVPVTIPIFDSTAGEGTNMTYHIVGFASFRITNVDFQGSPKEIDGKFQKMVDSTAEGGCANYGDLSVKIRPPIDTKRTLLGVVKFNKVTPVTGFSTQTSHVPVDVVEVLDISGSMNDPYGGPGQPTKLTAAKNALTAFNSYMQPSLGDQVALVTFPRMELNKTKYNYSCTQKGSWTTYYYGDVRHMLTNNIATVNSTIGGLNATGGTPLADGIRQGRQTVLGTGHTPSRAAVMIVASDGIANILLNGQWTGLQGESTSTVLCNEPAVQDAINQANIAKADTTPQDYMPDVTVFTIAVGNDFNADALRHIASPDTNGGPPHYFLATNANDLATVYSSIATRVEDIAHEGCSVIQTSEFASNATVNFRNRSTGTTYSLQTMSTGQYILPNAPAGTYEFTSATITVGNFTYNVFTDGVGGPPYSGGAMPTVEVGIGSGTYKADLALKTSSNITCPAH